MSLPLCQASFALASYSILPQKT
ncbi:hypothetical protein NC652_030795 [Populus alba x Populus x berolinensis]|nr:hypothetical protein NC652_030795 [Populus alba x Populus x berolinensis]